MGNNMCLSCARKCTCCGPTHTGVLRQELFNAVLHGRRLKTAYLLSHAVKTDRVDVVTAHNQTSRLEVRINKRKHVWCEGWTPLHAAAATGNGHIAAEILKRSWTAVEAVGYHGERPHHVACLFGNRDVLRLLFAAAPLDREVQVERMICVSKTAHDCRTALHCAVEFAVKTGDFDCVEILLDHGADSNQAMTGGNTPLQHAEAFAQALEDDGHPTAMAHYEQLVEVVRNNDARLAGEAAEADRLQKELDRREKLARKAKRKEERRSRGGRSSRSRGTAGDSDDDDATKSKIPDGSTILPDGTVVAPDGTVTLPSGATSVKEEKKVDKTKFRVEHRTVELLASIIGGKYADQLEAERVAKAKADAGGSSESEVDEAVNKFSGTVWSKPTPKMINKQRLKAAARAARMIGVVQRDRWGAVVNDTTAAPEGVTSRGVRRWDLELGSVTDGLASSAVSVTDAGELATHRSIGTSARRSSRGSKRGPGSARSAALGGAGGPGGGGGDGSSARSLSNRL